VDGVRRDLAIPLVTPVSQAIHLHATLTHHLQTLVWPAALERLRVVGLEVGELPAQQSALFPETVAGEADPVTTVAVRLGGRYGVACYQGVLVDESHPVAERRSRVQVVGAS
jgi:hypothetical protein